MKKLIAVMVTAAFAGAAFNAVAQAEKSAPATPVQSATPAQKATPATPAQPAKSKATNGKKKGKAKGKKAEPKS
jgi:hypothetical protein